MRILNVFAQQLFLYRLRFQDNIRSLLYAFIHPPMLFPTPPPTPSTPPLPKATDGAPVEFTSDPTFNSEASYNGHKKSTVFAQWQKHLQKQTYETACHWTAELDVSGWQDEVWSKAIVYASKHIHLHSPSLPTLLVRNYAFYRHHIRTVGTPTSSITQTQPRNVPTLRQNLFQVMGLLALSAKGPVYTLPKVDPQKVNETELAICTHTWLVPLAQLRQGGDDAMVLRVLSTVCSQLELNNVHKAMYWLSVLIEYEKHQKKYFKRTISMMARTPVQPAASSGLTHVVVDGKSAHDWVWLLWAALQVACKRHGRPAECVKAFESLGFLFACDYTSSKRSTRMPILLHAMLLVRTDTADWSRSVYPNDRSAQLILKACTNTDIMYRDIATRRTLREQQLGLSAGADARRLQVAPTNNHARMQAGGNRHSTVDPMRNGLVMSGHGTRSPPMIVMHMDPDDPRATASDTNATVPPRTRWEAERTKGKGVQGSFAPSSGMSGHVSRRKKGSAGPCMSNDSARKLQIMEAIDVAFLS